MESSRRRSIRADGICTSDAMGLVLDALADRPEVTGHALADGRIHVGRTYRPTWALVAAIVTAPIVGLGLLFLLVRRTDSGEIRVVVGPKGSVVSLPGMLPPTTAAAVEAALTARPPSASPVRVLVPAPVEMASSPRPIMPMPAPASRRPVDPTRPPIHHRRQPLVSARATPDLTATTAVPQTSSVMGTPPRHTTPSPSQVATRRDVASADGLDDRTTARLASPPSPRPIGPTRIVVLRFAEGIDVHLVAGDRIVLGRDPHPLPGARAVAVPGGDRSVSKSHLAVEFDGTTLLGRDLHSTNGSSIDIGSGPRPLTPGEAVILPVGAHVSLGDAVVQVVMP